MWKASGESVTGTNELSIQSLTVCSHLKSCNTIGYLLSSAYNTVSLSFAIAV